MLYAYCFKYKQVHNMIAFIILTKITNLLISVSSGYKNRVARKHNKSKPWLLHRHVSTQWLLSGHMSAQYVLCGFVSV